MIMKEQIQVFLKNILTCSHMVAVYKDNTYTCIVIFLETFMNPKFILVCIIYESVGSYETIHSINSEGLHCTW